MSTEFGMSGEQIDALADELEVGDALLLALGAMLGLTATEAV